MTEFFFVKISILNIDYLVYKISYVKLLKTVYLCEHLGSGLSSIIRMGNTDSKK